MKDNYYHINNLNKILITYNFNFKNKNNKFKNN